MDILDSAIASPHWGACNTCARLGGDNGCMLEHIDISVYLGDWIVCDDYVKNHLLYFRRYKNGLAKNFTTAHNPC